MPNNADTSYREILSAHMHKTSKTSVKYSEKMMKSEDHDDGYNHRDDDDDGDDVGDMMDSSGMREIEVSCIWAFRSSFHTDISL